MEYKLRNCLGVASGLLLHKHSNKKRKKKNPQKNNRHITVSLRGYIRKARTAGVLKHSSLDNEVK